MSEFLPESPTTQQSGIVVPQAGAAADGDVALMQRVFGAAMARPDLVPESFMAYLVDFIQTSRLTLPMGQIQGYQAFLSTQVSIAVASSVSADESTTSTSYTNLTTAGPTLTGLSDGKYLVLFGCVLRTSSTADNAIASFQVNSTAASDNDEIITNNTNFVPGIRAVAKSLSNSGNSTLTMKYRAGVGGTAEFLNRWLIALRYDNV